MRLERRILVRKTRLACFGKRLLGLGTLDPLCPVILRQDARKKRKLPKEYDLLHFDFTESVIQWPPLNRFLISNSCTRPINHKQFISL